MSDPVRSLAVWCAHWPAVAAARSLSVPVAVMRANRVIAVNSLAERDTVSVGLRRREAQSRCPILDVVEFDPARDARAFEVVMGALDQIAPRWEVSEPGRCAVPARGPSRYHGGDRSLVAAVHKVVRSAMTDHLEVDPMSLAIGVAVADGPRAAEITAASSCGARPVVVPPGATAEHLGGVSVRALRFGCSPSASISSAATGVDDLIDVLKRLGLRRLGQFAALEPADVLARFGPAGQLAHDIARGRERTTMSLLATPLDLRVSAALDPPAEQVERAAFTAKMLADDLHAELAERGLACTRVLVIAETELGDRIERLWRHDGALSAAAIAQRVRWQLDGWLSTGRTLGRCEGGVSRVELVPDEVIPADGRQLGFWGGTSESDERAVRALARLQALLGAEAVTVPEWQGGRAPGERYRNVAIDAVDLDARVGRNDVPWPGSLPAPSPAVVWPEPIPAIVTDSSGRRVGVGGRGLVTAAPTRCAVGDAAPLEVVQWAGPWCVEQRWWDPLAHRRRARMQMVLDDAGCRSAHLLTLEAGRWWLEATYD